MADPLIKSEVLTKPYVIGRKVKVELSNTYILELSCTEAIEAQYQLSAAILNLLLQPSFWVVMAILVTKYNNHLYFTLYLYKYIDIMVAL
jgi:hypothetical protein